MDEWAELQQREHNLRSFQVQPKQTRRRGKNIPAQTFEPWHIAVAVRVAALQEKKARTV